MIYILSVPYSKYLKDSKVLYEYSFKRNSEIQKQEGIYMYIADSLCCIIETHTTLKSNYTPIKINLKKRKTTSQWHMFDSTNEETELVITHWER